MIEKRLSKNYGAQWAVGLAFFLRHTVFWLVLFSIQRLCSVIHFWPQLKDQGAANIFKTFYLGVRVDLALIGFITLIIAPSFLLWMALRNKFHRNVIWVLRIPFLFILFFSVLVHSGELVVYNEWGHKLSTRVFTHLVNPSELFRTAAFWDIIWFVFYSALQITCAYFLIRVIFKPLMTFLKVAKFNVWFYPIQLFVFAPLALLMSRGGWQSIPINISAAMFSQSHTLNDLSTNSTYYFLQSLVNHNDAFVEEILKDVNPTEAKQYMQSWKKNCSDCVSFLDTIRPNLVIVVLESWSSDVISNSGKIKNTTPNFDALIEDGLYFSNCYATSGTSEVGNASIFSGYPALPGLSLTLNQDKSRKIKALNQTLKPYGYTSSYLFGGDLKYANLGAFFLDHEFDDVLDENQFSHIKVRGKLNVYDTDLMDEFIVQLNKKKQPFMSVAFTGSTHSPWDIPVKWSRFYSGKEAGIVNTIRFADYALGLFVQKAKEQPWFSNSLFVFVADHGRTTPFNEHFFTPEFFKIPLLFWGPTLVQEFRGKTLERITSQMDLVATLLGQMRIPSSEYPYSRNQMCEGIEGFAPYSSTVGYGGISPTCNFFFNIDNGSYFTNSCVTEQNSSLITKTKWFLKSVWDDFKAI